MPFKLIIGWSGTDYDYTNYLVHGTLQISESLNNPADCNFTIAPVDTAFLIPPERAYVKIISTFHNKSLFTGFVASKPVRTYMARVPQPIMQGQLFGYAMKCSSDEHLVNVKSVPFIPAFVNRFQGDILGVIAQTLCSGYFDTTRLQPGDLVPWFEYDPRKSWSEVAKDFGDAARYRARGKNKSLIYAPYDDQPLGIEYNESKPDATFDPFNLNTDLMPLPTVNDVTIIGAPEAGNNREDYFIGDGFTGNFPLHHKTFKGASTLLLQESWNGNALNLQSWYLLDPSTNFDFTAGALNVIDPVLSHTLGYSYLSMHNGIEIAGSLDLEHGEFTFNDYCEGIIGGIYVDNTFTLDKLLAGYKITTPGEIIPPGIIPDTGVQGIGVGGVHIQPEWATQPQGDVLITEPNHNYVLQMVLTAPQYARYKQVFHSMDGTEYGGTQYMVPCSITFIVQDFDIIAARQFFYTPKVTKLAVLNVQMPVFVAYSLVNNQRLNLTITNTTVAAMPEGALFALTGPLGLSKPSGLILPMLPPASGSIFGASGSGFTGTVHPWPNSASGNIWPDPMPLTPPNVQEVLGFGLEQQVAQVTPGNETDTLSFYLETIPAAGTPIRFQSWESQAAVSRLQNAESIADEADVVGDDGLRSATVTDLNPLPRTSEDCDNAAMAFLKDRSMTLYTGTYTCTSMFFHPPSGNSASGAIEYYPTVGRMLYIDAPLRPIDKQYYLVTSLTITVLDLMSEIVQYQIGFGADLYIEKVIKNFVDITNVSILTPKDKANPPNPRFTIHVGDSFLPDLNNVQADLMNITADQAKVVVFDGYEGPIEIRLQDSNWGNPDLPDYVDTITLTATERVFWLQRRQIDQTWYLRPMSVDKLKTSRRTKVIRIMWPTRPAQPVYIGAVSVKEPTGPNSTMIESYSVQFGFNGDVRNIYGFELRAADDRTILVQKPVTAAASDLDIDLAQTPMPFLPEPYNTDFSIYAYFFNAQWDYSEGLPIDVKKLVTQGVPYIWSPGCVPHLPGDMFHQFSNFCLQPSYNLTQDAVALISFSIKGTPPVNQISKHVGEPVILTAEVQTGVGGHLGPADWGIGVVALDKTPGSPEAGANNVLLGESTMSDFRVLKVTAPDSALHITIDPPTQSKGMNVYLSAPNDLNRWFLSMSIGAQQEDAVVLGADLQGSGAPDDDFDHFVIQYKIEQHSGLIGAQISAVTTTTVDILGLDEDPSVLIGYTMSMLAKIDPSKDIPMANFRIRDNFGATISLGPNQYGEAIPADLTTIFDIGDVITIRMLPHNITETSWDDPMWLIHFSGNPVDGSGNPVGLTPGEEAGRLAWIIDGEGKGQVRQIQTNTATGFTLASPWTFMPNATSVIIIVDPDWKPDFAVQAYKTANHLTSAGKIIGTPNVQNLAGITWLIRALTVAVDGKVNTTDTDISLREAFAFAGLGQPVPYQRTLVLKDATVGTDVAPHLTAYISGVGFRCVGVLSKAITSDLTVTVRLNGAKLITVHIPAATPVDTPIEEKTFFVDPPTITNGDVFSWDVDASDGSKDVATVTFEWLSSDAPHYQLTPESMREIRSLLTELAPIIPEYTLHITDSGAQMLLRTRLQTYDHLLTLTKMRRRPR